MILHYLKTAFRVIKRENLFSIIDVLGLAIGMAACLLILHYVDFERSYDSFHNDADRIYRLRYERTSEEGQVVRFASCCPPAADFIRGNYSDVENIARLFRYRAVVAPGDQDMRYTEERMYFAEEDFFQIFDFPFLSNDPVDSGLPANSAFLSRSTAEKYFGLDDPLGKTITVDGNVDYAVTGIFEDIPARSHLKFDIILSYQNLKSLYGPDVLESWGHTGFYTYIKLKPGADPSVFQSAMVDLVQRSCRELMATYKVLIELKMQKLRDIHLDSHFMQEYEINGSRESVRTLFFVALIVILMAWFNHINLSTARALIRAREVGLRKIIGASRIQLILQHFSETLVLNILAVILTGLLVNLSFSSFHRIAGLPPTETIGSTPLFWGGLALMLVGGTFLTGAYPVTVVTSFKPQAVLRKRLDGTPGFGFQLRRILVLLQFVIALGLLTVTLTVSRQIRHMKNLDLGFDKDRILVVNAPRIRPDGAEINIRAFLETLKGIAGIDKVCLATEVPGRQILWDAGGIKRAGEDAAKGKNYQIVGIDYDFVDVFSLSLVEGRNFSREHPADSRALILNETAVSWMGFSSPREAIGKSVDYWGEFYPVIGVLSDYHQQSPKMAFEPHIYRLMPGGRGVRGKFAVKIGGRDTTRIIRETGEAYALLFPGNPYDYFFLDEYFEQQYGADVRFGRVIGIFSFLALFVTSLGIFGLSAFMSLQRRREIGIRKVLGASAGSIMKLLMRGYLILLGVSFLISSPFSLWGIRIWLNTFAFRISPDWSLLIIPLGIVFMITSFTLAANILKAARTDPIEVIKYE